MVDASPIWNEKLYMGSFPVTGSDIGSAGFDLLVLCAVEPLYMLGNPSEHETADLFRCPTFHAPFDDGPVTEEVVREARRGEWRTVKALRRGDRVLVTCNAGRNRSGLVIALAIFALFPTATSSDVIRLIKERRVAPCGNEALTNEGFIDLIHSWRRLWRKK